MEEPIAAAVAEIENGFQNLRSSIERRAFDELETHLCQQRKLFQSLPADELFVQELVRRGYQLVLWALDSVQQYRSECAKTLAESKQELHVLDNYLATSRTQAIISTLG
jgi:hypothetical protein